MNKNSNSYIIIYSTVMVVLVAAALSFTALSLKDRQAENVKVEKMGDILRSVGEGGDMNSVPDKTAYINEMYSKYIVDSYAVNVAGERIDGADAFNLLINLKAEYDKPAEERELPVFVSKNDQGAVSYIIPTWGTGLWGPVWGYVALADDWDTVNGIVLDHKGETPGLGAEISTPVFQAQFKGKKILRDDNVVAIRLVKSGAQVDDPYGVDAISGGTLTSVGVENMLRDGLKNYENYIKKQTVGADAAGADLAASGDEAAAAAPVTDYATSSTVNSEGNE